MENREKEKEGGIMEKEYKMSDLQIKETRLNLDKNLAEIDRFNQQINAWHDDIKNNIPNKKVQFSIRDYEIKILKPCSSLRIFEYFLHPSYPFQTHLDLLWD